MCPSAYSLVICQTLPTMDWVSPAAAFQLAQTIYDDTIDNGKARTVEQFPQLDLKRIHAHQLPLATETHRQDSFFPCFMKILIFIFIFVEGQKE